MMYFSEIVEKLNEGKWVLNENSPLVYEINDFPLKIKFFEENASISYKSELEFEVSLSEFSDFIFKDKEKDSENSSGTENPPEIISTLFFKDKKIFETSQVSMQSHKDLFSKLAEYFDDETCSPKYQVDSLIEDFSLNEKKSYSSDLYKLLLVYKERMETVFNNGFLKENSKFLVFLEEDSGKIVGNLGQTIKKNAKNFLQGGIGGLFSKGVDFVMSAGSRVGKSTLNDVAGSKSIMILTDKNVILARQDEINEYDFEDAYEILAVKEDELLAGVVDIYDDENKELLSNVAQTKWNSFKNQLRKLKKEASQIGFSDAIESSENEEDEFAIAEKKITKLKKMLDNGLISQDEFNSKKSEILAEI